MKILHVGNTGGIASLLLKGLRNRNAHSRLIVFKKSRFGFPFEETMGNKITCMHAWVLEKHKFSVVIDKLLEIYGDL